MAHVESGIQQLAHLRAELENGQLKIPQFQRDYVWDIEKAASLIDSILRGYPIGALIYWRTNDRLREVRNIGRLDFPEVIEGERVNYVLDGQQRLTSILAALEGEKVELRDGTLRDYASLRVHLNRNDDELPIVRADDPEEKDAYCMPLTDIWHRQGEAFDACKGEARETRDKFSDQLRTYSVPKVTLHESDLSTATEVFSRINTSGQVLTLFEIMVAKTFDPEQGFDLVSKFEEFSDELRDAGFDTIDSNTVLQLIALMLRDDCRRQTILNLRRNQFIETWPIAIENMKEAVDYVKSAFGIQVSRLLPYSSLLVPLSLFFFLNKRRAPTANQAKLLSDFFWRVGWSARYSSSLDTKLSQDKRAIESIVRGTKTRYEWAASVDVSYIGDTTFSTSSAFCKTVLALLASLQPRSFRDGRPVNLQNDWMHRANSMNFHHVFPKAYLKEQEYEEWQANSILNISLVDDYLNKRVIKARAPSDYMSEFEQENEQFEAVMKTHLIDTKVAKGRRKSTAAIWEDDYDEFLNERARSIVREVKKKMVLDKR